MTPGGADGLAWITGGDGDDLLILLHGLAATSRVWLPFLANANQRWPGRWMAVDLPGHGDSNRRGRYRIADYAEDIAALIVRRQAARVTILGHSLGGAVALATAAVGPPVARAFALGVKADWSKAELDALHAASTRAARLYATRDEAFKRHARQCGLDPVAHAPLLQSGVAPAQGGWLTVVDPLAFAIDPADMPALLRAARCPTHLACGDADSMVGVGRLRDFDPGAIAIAGAGHNAMVEAPDAVWRWLLDHR